MRDSFRNLFRRLIKRILLRNQFTSQSLRKYFAKNFEIVVGLYSYGCFDESRIQPGVSFGRYCSIANSVRIFRRNHPMNAITMHPVLYTSLFGTEQIFEIPFKKLTIEDDVWIGSGATILPSVNFIGRGSIIGAGSVVTHDVPAYGIVAGNPARLIKMRFDDEIIERVEKSRWWECSIEEFVESFREDTTLFPFPKKSTL